MKERVQSWAERLDLMKLWIIGHKICPVGKTASEFSRCSDWRKSDPPFDEPLANLDPKSGQDIMDLIDQIHEEQGRPPLLSNTV